MYFCVGRAFSGVYVRVCACISYVKIYDDMFLGVFVLYVCFNVYI